MTSIQRKKMGKKQAQDVENAHHNNPKIWTLLERKKVSLKKVKKAYYENFIIILIIFLHWAVSIIFLTIFKGIDSDDILLISMLEKKY